jgi:hypothetical protein
MTTKGSSAPAKHYENRWIAAPSLWTAGQSKNGGLSKKNGGACGTAEV